MSRRELALLHAKTGGFRKRLNDARESVRRAFANEQTWYVAFSAGKDSTVVLSLVREFRPDTPAVISIHKWRLPETTEYLNRVPAVAYVASGSAHGTEGWAANWKDTEEARAAFDAIPWFDHDADRHNFGRLERGTFLGLRKAENSYRRVLLNSRGTIFQSERHGKQWICNPIANWSALDVWAYIHSEDIDYNKAYDVMERLGLSLDQQRVGPLAVDAVLGYGQLAILKKGWPSFWNQYTAEHPEARTYA